MSIFYLGCDTERPSGQRGVAGAAKGPGLPGGEQPWEVALGFGVPCMCCRGEEQECGTGSPRAWDPSGSQGKGPAAALSILGLPGQQRRGGRRFLWLWGSLALLQPICLRVGWGKESKVFHLQTGDGLS